MGLLGSALRSESWAPWDDRWYPGGVTIDTTGGPVRIGPETMAGCGTVWAAVCFKSDAVAMCPPQVVEVDGSKRNPAPSHRAQRVLRDPNLKDTGFEFRQLMAAWLSLWGNAYARIKPSAGSFAGSLEPLHPARMKPVGQDSEGALLYEYRAKGTTTVPETLHQSEVLHYRGLSLDGFEGEEVYRLIRNAVWIALAIEQHVGTWLRKGTRLSGLLVPEVELGPAERKEMVDAWNSANAGPGKAGQVGVVPFNAKFQPFSSTNKDGQLVELSNQQVESLLRFMRVPGVAIGYQGDKASTYASADAFFEKGGIRHCIQPIVTAMEQREEKALLLEEERDRIQIKHNMDVLMRANTKDRYAALVQASGGPFMTGNEARAIDDMNPDPDPAMDKVIRPSNMTTDLGAESEPEPVPQPSRPRPAPANDDEDDDAAALRAKGWQFALDAASRVVRREVVALKGGGGKLGLALRYAKDASGWRLAVAEFYGKHAEHVVEALHVTEEQARTYAESQREDVLARGVAAVETWEQTVPQRLAALAYGE
jgi:HK97 family phage portal protein